MPSRFTAPKSQKEPLFGAGFGAFSGDFGWLEAYWTAGLAPGLLTLAIDMDVVRTLMLSLLVVYLMPAFAEVEYISPERQAQLEEQFNAAHFDASQDTKRLAGHTWSCDMYGARSHMQVQHGLKLYSWKEKSGQWSNSGAQLVSEYTSQNSALTGHKDRFEDQVKMTKDGQLVSRLTLADGSKSVLAYSVCKTL